MENSSDKYLHKKFKKQLTIEPKNQNDKETKAALPGLQDKDAPQEPAEDGGQSSEKCVKAVEDTATDNKESVPNQSTNQNSSSVLNSAYASSLNRSSISRLEEPSDRVTELTNSQSSNNCISYVISTNSRVLSNLIQQAEPQTKPVNFDIKCNVTEPISNAETSSILENVEHKQNYVTSKLVNLEKEDISSNHLRDQLEEERAVYLDKFIDKKSDVSDGIALPDKSTGGKHVCPYCNLACSKPSVLQKHIRAHTNERPYPCVSCGFSFKTRSNLYKHCRSRTHANRVMGNKAQEMNSEMELDSDQRSPLNSLNEDSFGPPENLTSDNEKSSLEHKSKPYKPRFHTVKAFFDSVSKENLSGDVERNMPENNQAVKANSELLSHHINELISKNNSIVNSSDPFLFKRKSVDNTVVENNHETHRIRDSAYASCLEPRGNEEPLNLTNKNRKRCLSEVMEPAAQKSLIKELLLKNLYADSNMQCPYCKMIFQTVTELELHKLRNCKGFTKSGPRYSRSSSVNVASILTQNKNAFDNIPYLQNTVFPQKSPGPFLGKTRLVESDKSKSFSFDDALRTPLTSLHSPGDLIKASNRYALSPLTVQFDKEKKSHVKLFGGEVKITHTSGETKSFKIDSKEDQYDSNYLEYGGKLSENRVVKSTLQSGATVLTNKSPFVKQESIVNCSDVIRVYEHSLISPSIDLTNTDKLKFNFENKDLNADQNKALHGGPIRTDDTNTSSPNNVRSPYNKYTNITDFSQNAVKLLAPNLKQLNLSVPGVPVPVRSLLPTSLLLMEAKQEGSPRLADVSISKEVDIERKNSDNYKVTQKPLLPQQKASLDLPIQQMPCNPLNLFVNGKIVRYVPGMPGPVTADPLEMAYPSNLTTANRSVARTTNSSEAYPKSPVKKPIEDIPLSAPHNSMLPDSKSPKADEAVKFCDMWVAPKTSGETSMSEKKSPNSSEPRKFTRPNSLPLKPSLTAFKQHHGLTPTVLNQVLISPDTPRVAKKYNQQMLHGNYFTYLGLKSSTKSVYCTLNKTQPVYVPHFKKLSMYSEWRQQDTKTDKLYGSGYDSRQKQQKYTTAGKTSADLIVHSSYKYVTLENGAPKAEEAKGSSILGGYECDEDYTYVRGRGRGRFVCDQCGIRCKKPSMLKKHLRTHSNDRPYTCNHCNFSFKTKGNLTKHMKSKAHTKNYAASNSSNSSNHHSGTQSSDSDTDDSGMDSSDESTRQQEHEAAYGLLSLSQKTSPSVIRFPPNDLTPNPPSSPRSDSSMSFMNTEEIAHMTKKNFAKNKILDQQAGVMFSATKRLIDLPASTENSLGEHQNFSRYLGKMSVNRPLTYPYTTPLQSTEGKPKNRDLYEDSGKNSEGKIELKSIRHFQVIQNYNQDLHSPKKIEPPNVVTYAERRSTLSPVSYEKERPDFSKFRNAVSPKSLLKSPQAQIPVVKLNDKPLITESVPADLRKRKISVVENVYTPKLQRNDEVMDLSVRVPVPEKHSAPEVVKYNGDSLQHHNNSAAEQGLYKIIKKNSCDPFMLQECPKSPLSNVPIEEARQSNDFHNRVAFRPQEIVRQVPEENNRVNVQYVIRDSPPPPASFKSGEYDNSAMETLADIATKQVKLEKNSMAKNVASEFLKLATKSEFAPSDGLKDVPNFGTGGKEVNELIVKPEENRSCTICFKNFSKPSQLRLHMNIHYLERPFRCDSCSVGFRTKGQLQKHERSGGHHNKLSSSPALSSSEPRPFKCTDCSIAFRIHGHLAKHLRSKMHIMKLECLAKIPFGLYAELERSNSLLTEINTADGDQCLESLKTLAKKVFMNDPNKLNQLEAMETEDIDS